MVYYKVKNGKYKDTIVQKIHGFYMAENNEILDIDSRNVSPVNSQQQHSQVMVPQVVYQHHYADKPKHIKTGGNLRDTEETLRKNLKHIFHYLYIDYPQEYLNIYTKYLFPMMELKRVTKTQSKRFLIAWIMYNINYQLLPYPNAIQQLDWHDFQLILEFFESINFINFTNEQKVLKEIRKFYDFFTGEELDISMENLAVSYKQESIENLMKNVKMGKSTSQLMKSMSIESRVSKALKYVLSLSNGKKFKTLVQQFPNKDFSKNRNPIVRNLYSKYLQKLRSSN